MEKMPACEGLRQVARSLSLICVPILIAAVSVEVIAGDNRVFSHPYLLLQLAVCCAFLFDWFVHCISNPAPRRYFWAHLLFLLLSIPWLNMVVWSGADVSRGVQMGLATLPLLRSFLSIYVVARWLVGGQVKRLLAAYVITVVLFTYLSALLFYDYEILVNPHLHNFGGALWWAWMNVTTVGAAIFPVTAVGKTVCVLLPIVGMAMFPIFTVYIISLFTDRKTETQQ